MMAHAIRFADREGLPAAGLQARTLIDGGLYDVRRVLAGPGEVHGPARFGGDACVCVLEGSVRFEVDGSIHDLGPRDVLWVPAGSLRRFVAGDGGVALLAVHLPASRATGAVLAMAAGARGEA